MSCRDCIPPAGVAQFPPEMVTLCGDSSALRVAVCSTPAEQGVKTVLVGAHSSDAQLFTPGSNLRSFSVKCLDVVTFKDSFGNETQFAEGDTFGFTAPLGSVLDPDWRVTGRCVITWMI